MPKEGMPRGRMSSYAFFVQTCREEHKKKHPGESVVFTEFSRKCAEKWKAMVAKEKKRFEDMADKDKARYELEMRNVAPGLKTGKGGKRKRTKDPNAPKRSLSGFFFFCHDERGKIKAIHPSYGVGDIAKELGKKWEVCPNKPKYEAMAQQDKLRYEREMTAYKLGGVGAVKKVVVQQPHPVSAPVANLHNDDDDDEEDEEDESD